MLCPHCTTTPPLYRKDGPGYQLLPELNIYASKGDVQIEKDVYDAFLGTGHPSHAGVLVGADRCSRNCRLTPATYLSGFQVCRHNTKSEE